MDFMRFLFDLIPFRNCWKKPKSVIDSTRPVDIDDVYGLFMETKY